MSKHSSRSPNDRYTGQRYGTYTAHKTGQPYGGLGPWLRHQEIKWLQHAVDAAKYQGGTS